MSASMDAPIDAPIDAPAGVVDLLLRSGVRRRYPARSLVFAEGDAPGPALVVESGTVEISTALAGTIGRCDAGELVGELSALDGLPRSASVQAQTDAVLVAVSPLVLAELMAADPEVRAHVTGVIGSRAVGTSGARGPVGQGLPVRDLARWILERRDAAGDWVDLPLDEASEALSCSRELLSRSIDHLVGRGMVALERGLLLVRSTPALRQLVADGVIA